jgi:hypothetical protein
MAKLANGVAFDTCPSHFAECAAAIIAPAGRADAAGASRPVLTGDARPAFLPGDPAENLSGAAGR